MLCLYCPDLATSISSTYCHQRPAPEIHASKGSEIFVPQFTEKYFITAIIPDAREDEVVKIIKDNGRIGKIFVSQVLRAVDIATDTEGEETVM